MASVLAGLYDPNMDASTIIAIIAVAISAGALLISWRQSQSDKRSANSAEVSLELAKRIDDRANEHHRITCALLRASQINGFSLVNFGPHEAHDVAAWFQFRYERWEWAESRVPEESHAAHLARRDALERTYVYPGSTTPKERLIGRFSVQWRSPLGQLHSFQSADIDMSEAPTWTTGDEHPPISYFIRRADGSTEPQAST